MLEQRDSRIIQVKVQDELKTAYLDYAMSSITVPCPMCATASNHRSGVSSSP